MLPDIKDMACECCGHKGFTVGVASSSIAAASFCWCYICNAMGAEPKYVCDAVLTKAEGAYDCAYFDYENDCYRSFQTDELIPILMKDGRTFNTYAEYEEGRNK